MCITWNSDERYAEFYPDGIDILRKFSTVKGSSRRFNSVVAIKLKDTETLIIIHIELQSSVHQIFTSGYFNIIVYCIMYIKINPTQLVWFFNHYIVLCLCTYNNYIDDKGKQSERAGRKALGSKAWYWFKIYPCYDRLATKFRYRILPFILAIQFYWIAFLFLQLSDNKKFGWFRSVEVEYLTVMHWTVHKL